MECRKVLFTFGMSNDAIIIITDAPKEAIEDFCKRYNKEIENGQNTYFDSLKTMYYVKVLHDSEIDDPDNVENIGYDEIYDLKDY